MVELKTLIRDDLPLKTMGGIPLCFKDGAQAKKSWQLEAVVLLNQFAALGQMLAAQAKSPGILRATRLRLKNHAKACEEQVNCLLLLLAPLNPVAVHPIEAQTYLQSIGHRQSTLGQYFPNLFRDWTWGEKENSEMLELLKSLLPPENDQQVLFMGAGGGRLAYDYHRWAKPALTLVNDLNPLLLLIAKQMAEGNTLELFEMPPIPVDDQSSAIKQKLSSPGKADENLQFLLGDATAEIFKKNPFDAVVTQWFIDDCGQDIHELFPKINALLKPGGKWINIGPLIYRGGGFATLYSSQETVQIAEHCGFKVEDVKNEFAQYLNSPLWRNRREDMILSFRAVKTDDCEAAVEDSNEVHPARLEWLDDKSKPIPLMGDVKSAAQAYSLMATVFKNIDGKTSVAEIELEIVQKLGMPEEIAVKIVGDMLRGLANARLANPVKS